MGFRVALCQLNTLPGDVPGNLQKIRLGAGEASRLGADLAAFPELCLVGYCPRDLLFRRRFQEAAEGALSELAAESGSMGLLIGTFGRNTKDRGRPFTNDAVLLSEGRVRARVAKTLLP